MKGGYFAFDHIDGFHYKYNKINVDCGGWYVDSSK